MLSTIKNDRRTRKVKRDYGKKNREKVMQPQKGDAKK